MKRLIAYSSVSHLGFVMLGIAALSAGCDLLLYPPDPAVVVHALDAAVTTFF